MSSTVSKFWSTLFDIHEEVCMSTDVFGTSVLPMWYAVNKEQFFAINPLRIKRADANVTAYRNILLEFDKMDPHDQLELLTDIPHSTLVWSGGKSYHAILSLSEPCKDRTEYDKLVDRIYSKVPQADKSARNPSRFSRIPGVIRDNGNIQSLVHVKGRLGRAELEAWLGPELPVPPKAPRPLPKYSKLGAFAHAFLSSGASAGHWNRALFLTVLEMARAGFDEETIYNRCEAINGYLDKSDRRTIQSALAGARRE